MSDSTRKIIISKRIIMTGEDVRITLAKNIKKYRAQKGMSQAALAEEADAKNVG
jgi:DNA-binding XRE family transcriptional regulator